MSGQQIIPVTETLPQKIFIIPLQGKPIFPGIFTPIMISGADDIAVVKKAMESDKVIGLVLTTDPGADVPHSTKLYKVGTVAKIVKKINLPDGSINVFISTLKRFRIQKILNDKNPYVAAVSYLDDKFPGDEQEIKALTRALLVEMKQLSEDNPLFSEEMRLNMINIDNPGKIADFITSILNIDRERQQEILETMDVRARMEIVLLFIRKEYEVAKIQKKISRELNDKIEKNQREYFLREELKAIKQELGEPSDARSGEYQKFKEAIDSFNFEEEIAEQVQQELEKFRVMEPSSSEFMVTRNYLDLIVNLPWNIVSEKKMEMKSAQRILEKDHYGLEDVKERILEYLAVRKLKGDTKGSIILLVGPPGVGKTSIGKSIARAMRRPFFRFSVGGMRDEAEIKGHRRTYVGAMPGKILQGLKIVKSRTAVFMIDEIDKLGVSYQGDPSSALLEVLDPEQNIAFRDHYLDLPFDLSHVVFIATANTVDSIPRPLLDRMELIRLSGYITEEKMEIAKRYVILKSLKKHGLQRNQIRFHKTALKAIAEGYARDAGMRTMEKAVDRIHRKAAWQVVNNETELPIIITTKNLETYLKQPPFKDDNFKKATVPGITLGLAWTSLGGDVLVIEAEAIRGKRGLKLTGQMGDVMKESAGIALTRVCAIAEDYGILNEYFEKHTIHLHIPEGAIPKDGPSAGITMATALLSLATNTLFKPSLAMTGELSLTGRVMGIGGLKEKVIAAQRHQIKEIIIPESNLRDLGEIPEHVKKGIVFHPMVNLNQVIELALPPLTKRNLR